MRQIGGLEGDRTLDVYKRQIQGEGGLLQLPRKNRHSGLFDSCESPLLSVKKRRDLATMPWFSRAIPHNSKCRYGERRAAADKPPAQIILDAAKVNAAGGDAMHLRSLLDFNYPDAGITLDEVESVDSIVHRFKTCLLYTSRCV